MESQLYNYTQSGPAVPRAMQMQTRVGLLSIDPDRSSPTTYTIKGTLNIERPLDTIELELGYYMRS